MSFSLLHSEYVISISLQLNLFYLQVVLRACFHYEHGIEYSLFVLLIFFALLSARLDLSAEKSIKERKNASFQARSRNEPL